MAIRKSAEATYVVDGQREQWLGRCAEALRSQGFRNIRTDRTLFEVSADLKRATVWGSIAVALIPEGNGSTRLVAKATANVDNVFSLFKSPTGKILDDFKSGL